MGGEEREKQKADPRIAKIPDSGRNSAILLFRSAPWGSGRRSDGAAINAQHPTRQRKIHETAADGVATKQENKRPTQESLKFWILVVIHPFYRPVAFRGVPLGSAGRAAGVDINTPYPTRKN